MQESCFLILKGTSFKSGQDIQTGFKSDAPVALYMKTAIDGKGIGGKILSSGSKVTFYAPDISSVKLEGRNFSNVNSGANWLSVNIPEGTYELEILRLSDK